MNFVALFMSCFAMLALVDRLIGNRFGLGKELERGFYLFGNMALSMLGMIVISPLLADLMSPLFDFFANTLKLDPSIIPASLFANDMGGAPLSTEVALDSKIGMFNALVVSSMMGCTISFTIPYAINNVDAKCHKEMLVGFLCGIITIPIGCFVAGLVSGIHIVALLLNLLPLFVFALIISIGLLLKPMLCVKIFSIFGKIINIIIMIGLGLGILEFLIGIRPIKGLTDYKDAAMICVNAATVMSGAFPFVFILSKILNKPMKKLGAKFKINEVSAIGFVTSLATSVTTFENMKDMDNKGIVFDSAFAISAAFTFAGHLAFTLAFDANYIFPVIIGKLIAGVTSLLVATLIYKRVFKNQENS